MAYTEFCCRAGGSNLNAGTRTGNSTIPGINPDREYVSGNWVSATKVFTLASGNPVTDGVAVGDYAAVFGDGATVWAYLGRVTAVSSTTITVNAAGAGALTDGTGNRTLRIGGAWAGPSGSSSFPLNQGLSACTNSSGHPTRVNLKNDQSHSMSAGIVLSDYNGLLVSGFGTTYGDGQRTTVTGPTTGASFNLFSVNSRSRISSLILMNNGLTGSAAGVSLAAYNISAVDNCSISGMRGYGVAGGTGGAAEVSCCEVYGCAGGGFNVNGSVSFSISHDNTGVGFYANGGVVFANCIADSNSSHGFHLSMNSSILTAHQCVSYGNGSAGFYVGHDGNGGTITLNNCLTVGNSGWGLLTSNGGGFNACLMLKRLGTFGNVSGAKSVEPRWLSSDFEGVSLASNPFQSAATGDFRLTAVSDAKSAGFGAFTQVQGGYTGSIGMPDIGAVQSVGGGGGVRAVNIRGGADQ